MATFKCGDIVKVVLNEKSTGGKSTYNEKEFKVELVKPASYKNYDTGFIYRLEGCGALLFSESELVMVKEKIITEEMRKAMETIAESQSQRMGVPDNVVRKIKSRFKEQLSRRGYAYQDKAINTIFDEWLEKKAGLIALLSKHPQWDEEQLMVHFDTDFTRQIASTPVNEFIAWLERNTNIKTYQTDPYTYPLWYFISDLRDSVYLDETNLNKDRLDYVNGLSEKFNFREGMKTTKVVGKIAKELGWDNDENYRVCKRCATHLEKQIIQRDINGHMVDVTIYVCPECGRSYERSDIPTWSTEYAKFCDALSPLKITRHTCISLNPVDYLLMSNGNSWRSCHYIGDDCHDAGCYSSGTISYMLDSTSIIFFTVDGGYEGNNISTEPKIQRQVFAYNDGRILQSRLYPQCNDCGATDTYTDIRNVMQKVIADCLNLPNLWVKKKGANGVKHGYGATCYPDWDCQSNLCSVSTIKGLEDERRDDIIVGAAPICIWCGDTHGEDSYISCCGGSAYTCTCCGYSIDEDDVFWIDDEPYCNECVSYCECCDEYHRADDMIWISSESRDVCRGCVHDYYVVCEHCGEYVYEDDAECDENGRTYCSQCASEYIATCAECGCVINLEYDEVREVNGKLVCEDCADTVEEGTEEEEG